MIAAMAYFPFEVICRTTFADTDIDDTLFQLDGDNGAVKLVDSARKTSSARFLTYGLSLEYLGLVDSKTSGIDGWGMVENEAEKNRYIGELKNGLEHGHRVKIYAKGSTH